MKNASKSALRLPFAALALGLPLLAAAPARAELTLSISQSYTPPGFSGAFDVLLTNPDATPYADISAFSYELQGASGVTFADIVADPVGVDGTPYVFPDSIQQEGSGSSYSILSAGAGTGDVVAGDSQFPAPSDPSYTASPSGPLSITLDPGQTVSLGDVYYSVDPGVTYGLELPVTFASVYDAHTNPLGTTSLSDANANPLPLAVENGSISATPEPSQVGMLALLGVGLGGLLLRARRRLAA